MRCPNCGKQLEDRYRFCTRCGTALPRRTEAPSPEAPEWDSDSLKKLGRVLKLAAKGIVVILVVIYLLDPYRNVLGIKSMRTAYTHAKEVVSNSFTLPPSELDFPRFDLEFIDRSGKITYEGEEFSLYIIDAYVDAPNAFGTVMRHEFTVKIGLPADSGAEYFYYEEPSFDY